MEWPQVPGSLSSRPAPPTRQQASSSGGTERLPPPCSGEWHPSGYLSVEQGAAGRAGLMLSASQTAWGGGGVCVCAGDCCWGL